MSHEDLTDEQVEQWAADDPYNSTRTRKQMRSLAVALRDSRAEIERLRAEQRPPRLGSLGTVPKSWAKDPEGWWLHVAECPEACGRFYKRPVGA